MKTFHTIFLLLCVALVSQAQKVINDPNAEVRGVGSFSGVSVSSGIDLYLSGGDEAVAVSASKEADRNRIHAEVEKGVLKIWYEANPGISIQWSEGRNLKAYVSYKTLKSLSASGGSDVLVDGIIKSDELRIDLSGGSDFKGGVDVQNLRVNQTGGSDISISGKAVTLSINATGGSDFNGYDLAVDVCDLDATGGSDIEITANKELSARATGASDINYRGKPELKVIRASGASSVKGRS